MKIKGLIKNSVMLTIGKGSRTMLMLLYAMFASRYLSQAVYGTYKQMVLINTMLESIIPFGLPISISYYYQNLNKEKQSSLVTNTILSCFILSIACVTGMQLLRANVIVLFNNPSLNAHFSILSLYVFVSVFFHFINNLYVSVGSATLLGKINIIFAVFFFSGIILATWLTSNLSYVFGWMFVSELIKYLIMCVLLQRKHKYNFKPDWAFLKEQLIYCVPLGLVSIVQFINNYLDKLFISNRLTTEQYAIYVNGATDIPFINLITVSIATVALPALSKMYNTDMDTDGMVEAWRDTQKKAALILYPIFWALLLCSSGVILFLYSDKYLESIPIFNVSLLKMITGITVYGNILIVLRKHKYSVLNFCITIVVNMILINVFTSYMGMIGAAVSLITCKVFMMFLQLYQIGRFTGCKIRSLMPFGDLAKILLSGGAVTLILFAVRYFLDFGDLLNMFIYGPLVVLGCFTIYLKLGFIEKSDIIRVFAKFSEGFLRRGSELKH